MSAHEDLSFQLTYGDCDVVGIAYFAIYYPWMERAYSTWLFSHDIRGGELQEKFGVYTVGVHAECTYLQMVRLFDQLTIRLDLERVGTTSYTLAYSFLRHADLVTRGTMTFACRNLQGEKAAIPEGLLEVLRSLPSATTDSA